MVTLHTKLFSEAWNQSLCGPYGPRTHLSALRAPFDRMLSAYRLEPPLRLGGRPILLRPSLFQRITIGTGILTCIPSTTPFGLALGHRLTLGGQPFPRKPWTYGQQDSHLLCRYSCQHTHFHAVQHTSRYTFSPHGTLPYRLLAQA